MATVASGHAHEDLAGDSGAPLMPPDTARFGDASPSLNDSARNSFSGAMPATPDMSRPFLTPGASNEKILGGGSAEAATAPARKRRWPLFAAAGAIAVVVIVLAVVLPVTLVHHHKNSSGNSASGGAAAAGPSSNPESPTGATSGGNGTVIKTEDGVTFTYINNFGGMCKLHCIHFYCVSNTDCRCRGR